MRELSRSGGLRDERVKERMRREEAAAAAARGKRDAAEERRNQRTEERAFVVANEAMSPGSRRAWDSPSHGGHACSPARASNGGGGGGSERVGRARIFAEAAEKNESLVGRCGLTLSNPRLNRLELSACDWNTMNCFQILLSISTCAATAWRRCGTRRGGNSTRLRRGRWRRQRRTQGSDGMRR